MKALILFCVFIALASAKLTNLRQKALISTPEEECDARKNCVLCVGQAVQVPITKIKKFSSFCFWSVDRQKCEPCVMNGPLCDAPAGAEAIGIHTGLQGKAATDACKGKEELRPKSLEVISRSLVPLAEKDPEKLDKKLENAVADLRQIGVTCESEVAGAAREKCIVDAVAVYMRERINVIDCAFQIPSITPGSEMYPCENSWVARKGVDGCGNNWGVADACRAAAAGTKTAFNKCTMWAAFEGDRIKGFDNYDTLKDELPCKNCNCDTKKGLVSLWADVVSSPLLVNCNSYEEGQKLLCLEYGTGEILTQILNKEAAVCASLAGGGLYALRKAGLKGPITWVTQMFRGEDGKASAMGHEYIRYGADADTYNFIDNWYFGLYMWPSVIGKYEAYDDLNEKKFATLSVTFPAAGDWVAAPLVPAI
jgi:hypothetical protein